MKKRTKIISWIVIIFIFYSIGSSVEEEKPKPIVEKEFSRSEIEACHFSKEYMEGVLLAPASAKFQGCILGDFQFALTGSGSIYKSHVDSQNGFGAMIRTDYLCNIEYLKYPEYNITCTF